ncbi:ATP-binding protein [Streptomyces sp. LP11]|uniref:ATP-binding protein n=1 Tax=Streptomyces pyxinicus TaxID=2970331 RepID=A0ABT2BB50_9ACTN|nr:ATP-binding protein [Streptomyces sp. LP11]MCS0605719.1 ATP-binding protein [Streptomyces sp. LP11]
MLAREVHDRIGSGLALALRRLDMLETTAAGSDPDAAERLRQVRAAVVDVLCATRQVTSALRDSPPAAAGFSVEDALRSFVRAMEISEPHVDLRVDGMDGLLPATVADAVFLAVREALRNAVAHANAGHVAVHLTWDAGELHASVADDGDGFDPATVARRGSTNGLLGMRERIQAVGGVTTVTSAPRRGTRITLWVPVKERNSRHV